MMGTEQKTNMPQISKEKIEQLKKVVANAAISHFKSDLPDIISADQLLQELLDQPEGEPVAIYQYQMANGSWIDQDKQSYDYNVRHGEANVRIVYTHPAPFTPITADMVTDEMVKKYDELCYDEASTPQQHLAAVLNLGAKK